MKKYLSIIFLLTFLVSGCSNSEELENPIPSSKAKVFTASFEQNESRTYLENDELFWNAGDLITIFDGYTYNSLFKFDGQTGDNSGDFSEVSSGNKPAYSTGNKLSANYAVYPYDSNMTISKSGVITATLPAEQSYAENSFGQSDNTMVAVTKNTDDTFLKFKNVGGYLELWLYGEDVTVKSITLTGNNNEKLAGTATITSTYGSEPTISMANDATQTITLDCGEGVKIGTSDETATAFWLVVPPTTFESGFTVTITDINGGEFTKSTSKKMVIERNVIQSMAVVEVETMNWFNPNQYITYVKNHEWVYVGSRNYYQYSSYIDCPIENIGKIEFKYKLTDLHLSHYIYLCCKNVAANKTSSIYLNKDVGLVIENKHWDDDDGWILHSIVSYPWDELNVEMTDCMTLVVSFKDKYIYLNNAELDYKISQYTDFNANYLFTYYTHENDEGIWCERGDGVPEGSKLYYIKIWNESNNLVYLGAASKALNPTTNEEEYCWKSYCNEEYKYEFAYYPTTHSNYTPYGGGTD